MTMELQDKEFQYMGSLGASSPALKDSGKLSKQKLKFGMEEILGKVSDTKPEPVEPPASHSPSFKAYLKKPPDLLQLPKLEPRVSPVQAVLEQGPISDNLLCDT